MSHDEVDLVQTIKILEILVETIKHGNLISLLDLPAKNQCDIIGLCFWLIIKSLPMIDFVNVSIYTTK